jgi:hypothetical protein
MGISRLFMPLLTGAWRMVDWFCYQYVVPTALQASNDRLQHSQLNAVAGSYFFLSFARRKMGRAASCATTEKMTSIAIDLS